MTQLMAVTDGQVETCCEALESLRKVCCCVTNIVSVVTMSN